jgi:hypothetical protein
MSSFQNLLQSVGHNFIKANEKDEEDGTAHEPQLKLSEKLIGITIRFFIRHNTPSVAHETQKGARELMLRRDSVAFPRKLSISFRQLLSAGADFVQLLRLAQAS